MASDAQRLLEERLRARGDAAEPDSALAATAAWALQSAYARRSVSDTKLVTTTAQRFGFAGPVLGLVAGPLADFVTIFDFFGKAGNPAAEDPQYSVRYLGALLTTTYKES